VGYADVAALRFAALDAASAKARGLPSVAIRDSSLHCLTYVRVWGYGWDVKVACDVDACLRAGNLRPLYHTLGTGAELLGTPHVELHLIGMQQHTTKSCSCDTRLITGVDWRASLVAGNNDMLHSQLLWFRIDGSLLFEFGNPGGLRSLRHYPFH